MSALAPPRIIKVPECSKFSSADYDESRAAQFDPRDSASLRDYAPSTVGGFVLGSLCAAAALSLAAWLVWTQIKKRSWKHELQSVSANGHPQQTNRAARAGSIEMNGVSNDRTDLGGSVNVQMGTGRRGLPGGAKAQPKWALNLSDSGSDTDADAEDPTAVPTLGMPASASLALAVLAIATVAACVWAAVAAGTTTNSGAVAFWQAIDATQQQVAAVEASVKSLVGDSDTIRSALQVAHDRVESGKAQLPGGVPSNTTALLQQTAQDIKPIVQAGRDCLGRIQTYAVQALQSFEKQFQEATQRTRRLGLPIVFPVCYSIFAAACLPLAVMAALGRRPRLTGWCTVLLWLLAGFLLLFGAGVLHGSTTVTKDSCLYAEALIFSEAQRLTATTAAPLRRQLLQGLRYYLGLVPLPVHTVASTVYGLDFFEVQNMLMQPQLQQVLVQLSGDAGKALLGANGSGNSTSTGTALHTALPRAIDGVPYHVGTLADEINVETINKLHQAAKEALCCKWSNDSASLFAAWTAAGVLSVVLCAAVSLRVHGLVVRPGRHSNLLSRLWHWCS